MTFLSLILSAKIGVTLIFVALPFLFVPIHKLEKLTDIQNGTTLFRLYGIAILALLIGYISGFWIIAKNEFPWGVVLMGLVSNAGAALIMFSTGYWRKTKLISAFLALIACSLMISLIFQQKALQLL